MKNNAFVSRSIFVALVCLAPLLGACNKAVGGKFGTALGRVGESALNKAGFQTSGAIQEMTAEMGGLVGEEITAYLNDAERKQATSAAADSLNSNTVGPGSTRTWTSQTNSGVAGGSTVIAQSAGADGRECRTQRNFVNVKGKDVEQTETLCRDPRTGVWSAKTV